MKESIKKIFEALYNISFANPLSIGIMQMNEKNAVLVEDTFKEIFDNEEVRPFISMLLGTDHKGNKTYTDFGRNYVNFVKSINELFSNEELLVKINKALNLNLTNPLRDYACSALDQLENEDRMRLCRKIVRILAEKRSIGIEALNKELKERFDVEINIEEIKKRLKNMNSLLMLESFTDSWVSIDTVLANYVLEATKDLEVAQ